MVMNINNTKSNAQKKGKTSARPTSFQNEENEQAASRNGA
jgi:hypothetical protein